MFETLRQHKNREAEEVRRQQAEDNSRAEAERVRQNDIKAAIANRPNLEREHLEQRDDELCGKANALENMIRSVDGQIATLRSQPDRDAKHVQTAIVELESELLHCDIESADAASVRLAGLRAVTGMLPKRADAIKARCEELEGNQALRRKQLRNLETEIKQVERELEKLS